MKQHFLLVPAHLSIRSDGFILVKISIGVSKIHWATFFWLQSGLSAGMCEAEGTDCGMTDLQPAFHN